MDIHDWVRKLRASGKMIIVEGKNDKKALEDVGISNVHYLNRALFAEVDYICSNSDAVVILTDLDKEGRKLYCRLKRDLCRRGVNVDNKFREFLFETELTHIEGLVSYLAKN